MFDMLSTIHPTIIIVVLAIVAMVAATIINRFVTKRSNESLDEVEKELCPVDSNNVQEIEAIYADPNPIVTPELESTANPPVMWWFDGDTVIETNDKRRRNLKIRLSVQGSQEIPCNDIEFHWKKHSIELDNKGANIRKTAGGLSTSSFMEMTLTRTDDTPTTATGIIECEFNGETLAVAFTLAMK